MFMHDMGSVGGHQRKTDKYCACNVLKCAKGVNGATRETVFLTSLVFSDLSYCNSNTGKIPEATRFTL